MVSRSTIPLLAHTPLFSVQKAASIAEDLYGIRCAISPLPSERDQNFLLTSESNEKFVLRIANGLEDTALIAAQIRVSNYLSSRFHFCQRTIPSKRAKYLEEVTATNGATNLVRLNTYLPGVPLARVRDLSLTLLKDFGHKVGLLDKALLEFDDPAIHREFHWDLANWQAVVENFGMLVRDEELRATISRYVREFERQVAPLLGNLRRSCIHGDANDYNVLVDVDLSLVTGIIDFGDVVHSYTINDLAIGLAYVVLNTREPLNAAKQVVSGYQQALAIGENEIEVLWSLLVMRLCMSVCLAAYQQQQRPDNDYLDISQKAIAESLPRLLAIDPQEATAALKEGLSL